MFYYRVHSPVILIEFDHQTRHRPRRERAAPSGTTSTRVVRTPNGNDYGKDLLRQHYEQHKHDRGARARSGGPRALTSRSGASSSSSSCSAWRVTDCSGNGG